MNISMQNLHNLTDVAGKIYASNSALEPKLERLTTKVSSLGQTSDRPVSTLRRWTTRAAAAAAVSAIPALPMAALSVGPLALVAFGVGRNPSQPARSNLIMRGFDGIKAHGLLGLPELGAARIGAWAQARQFNILHKIAMGVAVVLGGLAQAVRVPVALAQTGIMCADTAAQMVSSLAAAAFGAVAEQFHRRGATATA